MRSTTFLWMMSTFCLMAQSYDLVISGAKIVDGTGSPWFHGDLAVTGDRIVKMTQAGLLKGAPAKRRMAAMWD